MRDVIVVGGSAGALQGVIRLVAALSADLQASVLLVLHTTPGAPGTLPLLFDKHGLAVGYAQDGEMLRHGRVYVAPPDQHLLLVEQGVVRVAHGPRENNFRPAVDPLFRTAARTYGPRVVGVVLSGGLDDGTSGLASIKARGGIAIVQHPDDALVMSMPLSAIRNVAVDHVVPVSAMAELLIRYAEGNGFTMRTEENYASEEQNSPDAAEAGTDRLSEGGGANRHPFSRVANAADRCATYATSGTRTVRRRWSTPR